MVSILSSNMNLIIVYSKKSNLECGNHYTYEIVDVIPSNALASEIWRLLYRSFHENEYWPLSRGVSVIQFQSRHGSVKRSEEVALLLEEPYIVAAKIKRLRFLPRRTDC
jgi:hypothetical protein